MKKLKHIKNFDNFNKINEDVETISTKDCVEFIINNYKNDSVLSNPKNWKRIKKVGTTEIIRTFENKISGKIVNIVSTKNNIIKILEPLENNIIDDSDNNTKIEEFSYIIKEYKTPTNVIVMGESYNGYVEVQILSDESSFGISIDGSDTEFDYCESDGFISILDVKSFINFIKNIIKDNDCTIDDIFPSRYHLIKNYVGKIRVQVKDNDDNLIQTSKYDMEDYIEDQITERCKVFIELEKNANVIKIDVDDYKKLEKINEK